MVWVLAVDPGKMTGVALFDTEGPDGAPILLESHEFERDELEDWLTYILDPGEDIQVEVVAERYIIGDADSPWSLRELGVLSYLSRRGGCGEPKLQTPADAKAFAPNERLKKLGYWHKGGAGHALDAIRHGILYMVRKQLLSPRTLLND
jgi:hypothetical protein